MSMPELVSCVDDRGTLRHPGVVDENIYVAHLVEHARDGLRISDVADQRARVVTDLTGDLFDWFGSPRCHSDAHALACEGQCDCATNASAAASDQSCFS